MPEESYALMLRNLSNDYYHNHIGFAEYRAQRKLILEKVDEEMNEKFTQTEQSNDAEVPASFMQTIGFFKNKDIDN